MTEAEWLASDDPEPMLEFIRGSTSARRSRLLACACCRPHASVVGGHEAEVAVTVAELQADGGQVEQELQVALCKLLRYPSSESLGGAYQRYSGFVVALDPQHYTLASALSGLAEAVGKDVRQVSAAQGGERVLDEPRGREAVQGEKRAQIAFLRDIFCNPFRPVRVDPSWLTSTVVALASQMYESRDFTAMPVLADALQDAGCDNDEVLAHCRGPGPHVRGCWVVDLVLGKE